MTCPAWEREIATLRRTYPHLLPDEANRRHEDHRRHCPCGSRWSATPHLPRDLERTKP